MSLDDAFEALRETSAADVAGIDVQAAVAARVRARRGLLQRTRRWAPALAAALIAMLVWQNFAAARSITIVAEGGGRIITGDGAHDLPPESTWHRPFVVHSGVAPIALRARDWQVELATGAVLRVDDGASLAHGAVRVDGELTVHAGTALAINGRALVRRIEDTAMRKRTATLLAAGTALVAVYVGHVTINGNVLNAPAAAVVDGQGRHARLSLDDVDSLSGTDSERKAASSVEVTKRDGSAAGATTGGYWDETHKLVRFRIAGEVLDASSGKAVEDYQITVTPVASTFAATLKRTSTITGATDGHFTIDGLSLGTWELTVSATGFAPSRQTVALTAVADDPYVVVPLTAGGKVTGVVVDARGEPVEGAVVAIGVSSTTSSDAKGAFVLSRAPEESAFTVTATHPRYGTASLPNVRLGEGESEHLTITLSGILRVSGHVYRGPNNDPVGQAVVKSGDATTLSDGQGSYTLFVSLEKHPSVHVVDGSVELVSYPEGRSVEPITWVTAKTHVAELVKDFHLSLENGRIVGRISEANGSPITGATLELSNTMGWSSRTHDTFPASTTTGPDGRYRIDDVPAHAAYQIALVRNGTTTILGSVSIDEPAEVDGSFTLASETLRGRFVDATSHVPFPLAGRGCDHIGAVRVGESAAHAARCYDDGTFEVTDLPAGRYRVVHTGLHVDTMQVTEVETDVPGSPIDVAITGDRANVWTMRVTSSDGAFVAEPVLRYRTGQTVVTSTLTVNDEGTTSFSVAASQPSVFVDAPGYAPATLDLANRTPSGVIDVRLTRVR